ncbi:arsenate reductase (glutaredoxin) [Gulbenkiania indica]|uniref:Arsenate reductase n=1 Tax=Gulbenkiania indica TaxID=375574 RepID=A0A0K6GTA4_9NEIS|nr:arsenate reductase (glutaredoxin) [Gulbenkiania indica]
MIRLYHNPRCSKSRQALALLEEAGAEVEVVEYLRTPPTADELDRLLTLLDLDARALLRTKEEEYASLHLDDVTLERRHLIEAMIQHPRLLERPIAVCGDRAVVGRPPERVLSLLEGRPAQG